MTQRIAFLSDDVDNAQTVVDSLRALGFEDDDIYVITNQDIILEDLPEADPRQYSDLLPALKKGAGVGGALGLFGGILMATVPPAGIVVGGAAIPALAAGGAAFGAWTSSLVGISAPNSKLEEFQSAVENGKTLVLVDAEDDQAESLIAKIEAGCSAEIIETAKVEAA